MDYYMSNDSGCDFNSFCNSFSSMLLSQTKLLIHYDFCTLSQIIFKFNINKMELELPQFSGFYIAVNLY